MKSNLEEQMHCIGVKFNFNEYILNIKLQNLFNSFIVTTEGHHVCACAFRFCKEILYKACCRNKILTNAKLP